jgi:hypothetical protein
VVFDGAVPTFSDAAEYHAAVIARGGHAAVIARLVFVVIFIWFAAVTRQRTQIVGGPAVRTLSHVVRRARLEFGYN